MMCSPLSLLVLLSSSLLLLLSQHLPVRVHCATGPVQEEALWGGVRIARARTQQHAQDLDRLVKGQAQFHRMLAQAELDASKLYADLRRGAFHAYLAYDEASDALLGMVTFYLECTLWNGEAYHMDDLYLLEEARGKRVGFKLLRALALWAQSQRIPTLSWVVAKDNTNAISFYKKNHILDQSALRGEQVYRVLADRYHVGANRLDQIKSDAFVVRELGASDVASLYQAIRSHLDSIGLLARMRVDQGHLERLLRAGHMRVVAAFVERDQCFLCIWLNGRQLDLAAFLLYADAYSSWRGQFLSVEEYFVQPRFSSTGVQFLLFNELVKKDTPMIKWRVLSGSDLAPAFFAELGMSSLSEEEGWLHYDLPIAQNVQGLQLA